MIDEDLSYGAMGLLLCTAGVLFHAEWYIRKLALVFFYHSI